MKLDVRHVFPCSADQFLAMFWDDDFDRYLQEGAAVNRTILSERKEGDVHHWRMRFEPDRELPGPVAKILGADKLVYEQETRLGPDRVLHWEVIPAVAADKVSAKGTMHTAPHANGIERIVQGEIKVRVPLVGGRIEKAIVGNVTESYEKAAEATMKWLASKHG